MKFGMVLLFLAFLSFAVQAIAEETIASSPKRVFVDYDGDGLDDNVYDLDYDGIPDFGNKKAYQRQEAISSIGTGIFRGVQADQTTLSQLTSNIESFSMRKCCVMALAQNRGGFGASGDFGPISGISQNAGGGNCAGGICR